MKQLSPRLSPAASTTIEAVDANEPLIGASGLASRSLITDLSSRPATLTACFAFVASHPDVPEAFRTEAPKALAIIAGLTCHDASQLPADPIAIRPIISHTPLRKHLASHTRWNVFGLLVSTLILTGWLSPEARRRCTLPEPWGGLLVEAGKHGRRGKLAVLFGYCYRRGLAPTEFNDATLIDYVEWNAQWTLSADPWRTAVQAQEAWRDMQARCPAWPQVQIRLPSRRDTRLAARTDLWREHLIISGHWLSNRTLITEEKERPTTLGACFDFVVDQPSLPERFRREARSAKATLGRLTGHDPSDLPTAPVALRPILTAVQPIHAKLSHKRWCNVLSIIRSTLILCGWLSTEARKRSTLPEPWAGLVAAARLHNKYHPLPAILPVLCSRWTHTGRGYSENAASLCRLAHRIDARSKSLADSTLGQTRVAIHATPGRKVAGG